MIPPPPSASGADPQGQNENARPAGPDTPDPADSRQRWAFLAEASRELAETLDLEDTLATVARLSLPCLGSWSIVDLTEEDGSVRRLAIVHPDEEMQTIARRLKDGWPPSRADPVGLPIVSATGRSEIIEKVTDDLLVEMARTDENLENLRALGMSSLMTVPICARASVLGAITFIATSSERSYGKADLSLAEDLAQRCGLAIDNARLHRMAAELSAAREREVRADAAAQVKSEFLTTVGHELRTPLHAISGYAELLAMNVAGTLTNRQRQFVDQIEGSGQQLLRLVEDMLNFIRLTSGKIEYNLSDVAIGRLVEDVVESYRPAIEHKGIAFEVECADGIRARTDPPKIWQILINLLSNARKATDAGGTIRIECVERAGEVSIRVADTGCGIPATRIDRIFEPFEQRDAGLTRTSEGIGLGLSISRQLARDMNGDLTVSSPAEGGCIFDLTQPLADDQDR